MTFSKYLMILDEQLLNFDDDEYLEQSVKSLYRSYSNNFICGTKNTQSIYLGVSQSFAELVGLHPRSIIGKTEMSFPCKVSEMSGQFYKQDRYVEKTRMKHRYLDIHHFITGVDAYIFRKIPIINPATNNVVGTHFVAGKLKSNNSIKLFNLLHQTHREIRSNEYTEKLKLTNREHEVLFCIAIGFTNRKSIAAFLSMVYKKNIGHETTVKDALNSLYQKLYPINSINLLRDYALANEYDQNIPKNILLEGSFFID